MGSNNAFAFQLSHFNMFNNWNFETNIMQLKGWF